MCRLVGASGHHGKEFDFDLERIETLVRQNVDGCWLWQPGMDSIEDGDARRSGSFCVRPNLHPGKRACRSPRPAGYAQPARRCQPAD